MQFFRPARIQESQVEVVRHRRQETYYKKLGALTINERKAYMRVFDYIARVRAVDAEVDRLVALTEGTVVRSLVREMVAVVEEAVSARERGDDATFRHMADLLEDISVATNALVHRQCLHQSRRSLTAYRALQMMARHVCLN